MNQRTMADVVALVSSEQNKLATKYLDEGNLTQCKQVLKENVQFLKINAFLCPPADAKRLEELAMQNDYQWQELEKAKSKDDTSANRARKSFRGYQNQVDLQQRVKSAPAMKTPR